MKALCFDHFGGADVLRYRDLPDPSRLPGDVLVRTRAIGLNFADIYRRRGNYHLSGKPPYVAGYEAAGEVVEVAAGSAFCIGQRVAFADSPHANAELIAVPQDRLIPLPDDIAFDTAAALLLQGLTAQYLCRDSHPLRAGETVLVHAAAGGVGLLLVQIAKLLGARVIGITSSARKREAALRAGAEAVALYDEDWTAAAREFSGQTGVDVAYDAVGPTLLRSFEAVRTGGHVVFYGMAGGNPPSVDPRMLMDTSKSLTGGDLWNVLTSPAERRARSAELFEWARGGRLHVAVAGRYPLADGALAHAFLESRNALGKVLLIP
ncbi:MAG: quinone oxidoreductase [Rudaea sp.]|nr:quinone oxidoreductase [Rudaea sp.]